MRLEVKNYKNTLSLRAMISEKYFLRLPTSPPQAQPLPSPAVNFRPRFCRCLLPNIHPGDPTDMDLYELSPAEASKIPQVYGSLKEALESLDGDRDFLKAGGVFDDDQIDAYIDLKMEEVHRVAMHPHPVEFDMYYKC